MVTRSSSAQMIFNGAVTRGYTDYPAYRALPLKAPTDSDTTPH